MNETMWLTLAREAYEAQQKEQEYAELKRTLLEQLKVASEHKSVAMGEYAFVLSYRKGSIDYGSIEELKKINLELYRKEEVSVWKLIKI